MSYERELTQRILKRWARREAPRFGEIADDRAPVRPLEGEDIRGFDNQALFYSQTGELIPGISPPPFNSMNFRWADNSGYIPLL